MERPIQTLTEEPTAFLNKRWVVNTQIPEFPNFNLINSLSSPDVGLLLSLTRKGRLALSVEGKSLADSLWQEIVNSSTLDSDGNFVNSNKATINNLTVTAGAYFKELESISKYPQFIQLLKRNISRKIQNVERQQIVEELRDPDSIWSKTFENIMGPLDGKYSEKECLPKYKGKSDSQKLQYFANWLSGLRRNFSNTQLVHYHNIRRQTNSEEIEKNCEEFENNLVLLLTGVTLLNDKPQFDIKEAVANALENSTFEVDNIQDLAKKIIFGRISVSEQLRHYDSQIAKANGVEPSSTHGSLQSKLLQSPESDNTSPQVQSIPERRNLFQKVKEKFQTTLQKTKENLKYLEPEQIARYVRNTLYFIGGTVFSAGVGIMAKDAVSNISSADVQKALADPKAFIGETIESVQSHILSAVVRRDQESVVGDFVQLGLSFNNGLIEAISDELSLETKSVPSTVSVPQNTALPIQFEAESQTKQSDVNTNETASANNNPATENSNEIMGSLPNSEVNEVEPPFESYFQIGGSNGSNFNASEIEITFPVEVTAATKNKKYKKKDGNYTPVTITLDNEAVVENEFPEELLDKFEHALEYPRLSAAVQNRNEGAKKQVIVFCHKGLLEMGGQFPCETVEDLFAVRNKIKDSVLVVKTLSSDGIASTVKYEILGAQKIPTAVYNNTQKEGDGSYPFSYNLKDAGLDADLLDADLFIATCFGNPDNSGKFSNEIFLSLKLVDNDKSPEFEGKNIQISFTTSRPETLESQITQFEKLSDAEFESAFNIDIKGGENKPVETGLVRKAVLDLSKALAQKTGLEPDEIFRRIYGQRGGFKINIDRGESINAGGESNSTNEITVRIKEGHYTNKEKLVIHEFGHVFAMLIRDNFIRGNFDTGPYNALALELLGFNKDLFSHHGGGFAGELYDWYWNENDTESEIFADLFLGWVYNQWAKNQAGSYISGWTNEHMESWLDQVKNFEEDEDEIAVALH